MKLSHFVYILLFQVLLNLEEGLGLSLESSATGIYPGPTLACDPALRYLFHPDLDLGEGYIVEELLEDHLLISSVIYHL